MEFIVLMWLVLVCLILIGILVILGINILEEINRKRCKRYGKRKRNSTKCCRRNQ